MNTSNIISQSLKNIITFIMLILFQVLVCNNILLFGVAVPIIFIYFILLLPINTNLNLLITVSFFLGFLIDLFSDTLGLNSLCCIILAVVRKPIFYAYMSKEEDNEGISPSIRSMGWENYLKYSASLILIYSLLVFVIEFCNFTAIWKILVMAFSSALLSLIIIVGIDSLINTSIRSYSR